MENRTFTAPGGAALTVSAVGLGCNNFGRRCDAGETRAVVAAALDAGVTLFDTSDSYGDPRGSSEEYLGRALGARREDVVIASKFGWAGGASPAHIAASVEASLKRLGTDRIDLYQLHKPDPATPMEDTLAALDGLVRQGKVRFIGCSNLSGQQLQDALAISSESNIAPFVTAQNQYSLIKREIEADLTPVCVEHGIGILPFYPLASGLLTGKYRRGETPSENWRLGENTPQAKRTRTDANLDAVERLHGFAEARGRPLLELAMSWLAGRPAVASVISGARTPEQVRENAGAAGWKLSEAELEEIDRLTF